jgi:hypothetical protein
MLLGSRWLDWIWPTRCALPLTLGVRLDSTRAVCTSDSVRLDSTRAVCTSPDSMSQIGLNPSGVHFSWLSQIGLDSGGVHFPWLWVRLDSTRAVCTSPNYESDWTRLVPTVLEVPHLQCSGQCIAAQPRCIGFPFRIYVTFQTTNVMNMYFSRREWV